METLFLSLALFGVTGVIISLFSYGVCVESGGGVFKNAFALFAGLFMGIFFVASIVVIESRKEQQKPLSTEYWVLVEKTHE